MIFLSLARVPRRTSEMSPDLFDEPISPFRVSLLDISVRAPTRGGCTWEGPPHNWLIGWAPSRMTAVGNEPGNSKKLREAIRIQGKQSDGRPSPTQLLESGQ